MLFTVRLCCNCGAFRDLTTVSPLSAFCHFSAADRAEMSRPASAEPWTGCHLYCQHWVSASALLQLPQEQLGYFQDTGVTALNKWNCHWGNVAPGRAFCSQKKELKHQEGGKGIVVFYPGDFCEALLSKMQQPGTCFLWAFKGGAHSRRIRWWGDTSQHRLSPKQANPASIKVRSRCAHPPCRAEISPAWSLLLSHTSHHKAVRKRKHFYLFPLVFFSS